MNYKYTLVVFSFLSFFINVEKSFASLDPYCCCSETENLEKAQCFAGDHRLCCTHPAHPHVVTDWITCEAKTAKPSGDALTDKCESSELGQLK